MTERHPPHIYLDDTWNMVGANTLRHAPLPASEEAKGVLRDTLKALVVEIKLRLRAWVILDDHYHLLLKTERSQDLSRFVGRLHGGSARRLNVREHATGRKVWHNYWDTCIRTEAGLWRRFNHIHNNPVKHGYVKRWEEWAWSSYRFYLESKGQE